MSRRVASAKAWKIRSVPETLIRCTTIRLYVSGWRPWTQDRAFKGHGQSSCLSPRMPRASDPRAARRFRAWIATFRDLLGSDCYHKTLFVADFARQIVDRHAVRGDRDPRREAVANGANP